MDIHEHVARHTIDDDRVYHIIKKDRTLNVPSIQGVILDLYKETIDNLTADVETGVDSYRHHLIAPATNELRCDMLPGPMITDDQYASFMPCFRDQRYMLYTIRPHHDYRYDTKNYLRGYEDTYRPMSSARLRDKIAVDYLCFDRAVKESGIDLSGKFKGFRPTMRTFIDELLETGHTLSDLPDRPKTPVLLFDLVNLVTTRVGVDRHEVIEEIRNA